MRILKLVLAAIFTAVLLGACSPMVATFVELPDTVKNGITTLILTGVSYVIVWLATRWSLLKFLLPYIDPIALIIASGLIDLIQTATPDAYGPIVILVVQLILAIIGLFTLVKELRSNRVRGFRW